MDDGYNIRYDLHGQYRINIECGRYWSGSPWPRDGGLDCGGCSFADGSSLNGS